MGADTEQARKIFLFSFPACRSEDPLPETDPHLLGGARGPQPGNRGDARHCWVEVGGGPH